MLSFRERLIAARTHAKASQSSLARGIGVKPQAIQHLESAEKNAKGSSHTVAIARFCGVSADWLERGIGSMLVPRARDERTSVRGQAEDHPGIINIPQMSVRASAGNGVMQMEPEYQVGSIQIPEYWLRKNIVCTSHKNLRTITVFGDSMYDTLDDGDVAFVDVGVNEIDRDGVYVASLDNELYIKTFERRPAEGVIFMRSDNRKKYPDPHIITKDRQRSLVIHARAVFAWNGRKL